MAIAELSGGGYMLGGYAGNSTNGLGNDFWILKTDATGGVLWQKRYGDNAGANDAGFSIIQTADLGYAIGAETATVGVGMADAWILKLHTDGTIAFSNPSVATSPVMLSATTTTATVTVTTIAAQDPFLSATAESATSSDPGFTVQQQTL